MTARSQRMRRATCCVVIAITQLVSWSPPSHVNADSTAMFGSVQSEQQQVPLTWEPADGAEISVDSLRIDKPGVTVRSRVLALRPLHLYDVTATIRRGPGANAQVSIVYLDARGQQHTWSPVWQLPGTTRPNWVPLSPRLQRYTQGFVLPAGARDAHVSLAVGATTATPVTTQANLAALTQLELTALVFTDRQVVPCCHALGRNALSDGELEGASQSPAPTGWSVLQRQGSAALVTLEHDAVRKQVLRVQAGSTLILISEFPVAVARGTAWQLSLWARGQGQVGLWAHSLDGDRFVPVRVAALDTPQQSVDASRWTALQTVWFAEPPGIQSAQVVLYLAAAQHDLEIDTVELKPYWR